jgi:hypothetical protein
MEIQCIHELDANECAVCNGAVARERVKKAPSAERYADAVFSIIPVEDEGWISQDELAEKAGLSGAQISSAVAYLRDNYPELPLVSSAQGYCYTLNEADINRFRLARQRSALTTYRRLWRGVIKPYIEKSVERGGISPREGKFLTKQYNLLLDALEDMTVV